MAELGVVLNIPFRDPYLIEGTFHISQQMDYDWLNSTCGGPFYMLIQAGALRPPGIILEWKQTFS